MSELEKNIFKLLIKSGRDPFCIIGLDGHIISCNDKLKNLLGYEDSTQLLFNYFDEPGGQKIEKLVEEVLEKQDRLESKNTELSLRNDKKLIIDVILNPFRAEEKAYIFLTIIPKSFIINFLEKTDIKLKSGNIDEVVSKDEIKKILNKITGLYPLTFIGKQIIHKLVDELEEYFWIIDNKGKYLLVNSSFAGLFGFKPYQVEGKSYQEFVPSYLEELYTAIGNYIKETLNCVELSGSSLWGSLSDVKKDLIEIPLSDNENNVIGLAGFSSHAKRALPSQDTSVEIDDLLNLIDHLPGMYAFLDDGAHFKHTSKDFCKLFVRKFNELKELKYSKVFTREVSDLISEFIQSDKNGIEIVLNRDLKPVHDDDKHYQLKLERIYGRDQSQSGFTIYIEKIVYADNLQGLLRSKGRMFELLIKKNPEPVFIYDKENLRFLEVNDAALELYGYTYAEFLQMDLTDLYSPEDIQTLLETSDKVLDESKYSQPFRHRRKDGSYVYVRISKIAFKFNERDAHLNILRDVTENLDLEKKNQLWKAAFDNSDNMIFVTDPSGIINYSNKAAANILGFIETQLSESSLISYLIDEDRAKLNSSVFQAGVKEPVSISAKFKNATGEELESEITATPVLNINSEVESFSILVKLLRFEEDKLQEPKEIVKEVIVEKPSSNMDSEGLKLDPLFLSGVFHEILTPMNVILGFAQELTESIESLTPEQREAVEIINQNRGALLSTMNSIIEFSEVRLKKSELDIDEIVITEIIDHLEKNISDITGAGDVEFAYGKISSSLRFETDRKKFEGLINNLIRLINRIIDENKIYFSANLSENDTFIISISDKYGATSDSLHHTLHHLFLESKDPKELGVSKLTAQITMSLLDVLGGKFVVTKTDEDKFECGFQFPIKLIEPAKPIPEVTEPFKEVIPEEKVEEDLEVTAEISPSEEIEFEEETVDSELTGLETGKIEVDEEPVQDSDQQAEEEATPEEEITIEEKASADETGLSSRSCLYIEDQVDSQILFKVQMKELKEIQFASSFEEAMPLLESQKFDFIVMDINLQGEYNGLDALKIIHKMPELEDLPIIAVTAYVLPGDKEKFIASGFTDFISKPIFKEKMMESLNKIFPG